MSALVVVDVQRVFDDADYWGRRNNPDSEFAIDATHAYDLVGPDGETVTAEELKRATAASLHGEFAQVVRTDELV